VSEKGSPYPNVLRFLMSQERRHSRDSVCSQEQPGLKISIGEDTELHCPICNCGICEAFLMHLGIVSCKHSTQDVCTVNMVREYHSMCKMVVSVYVAIETQRGYFVKYQNILLASPMDGLKYMENVSWKIFGDGCVGHKCMDTTVAQPTT
jgi:hypothetical protein